MPITRNDFFSLLTNDALSTWEDDDTIVPNGTIVFDLSARVIKEGNGINVFNDLPIMLNYGAINSGSIYITIPANPGDNGKIIRIANGKYSASANSLADILAQKISVEGVDLNQDLRIADQVSDLVTTIPSLEDENKLIQCLNGEYVPSIMTLQDLIDHLSTFTGETSYTYTYLHIRSVDWFFDKECLSPVKNPYSDVISQVNGNISKGSVYYARINGFSDKISNPTYMFEASNDFTVNPAVQSINPVFEIKFDVDIPELENHKDVSFTVRMYDPGTGLYIANTLSIPVFNNSFIYSIGMTNVTFSNMKFDSKGYLFTCCNDEIIANKSYLMKFDQELNLLDMIEFVADKSLFGNGFISIQFSSLAIDSNDNIFVGGGFIGVPEIEENHKQIICSFDNDLCLCEKYIFRKRGGVISLNITDDNAILAVAYNHFIPTYSSIYKLINHLETERNSASILVEEDYDSIGFMGPYYGYDDIDTRFEVVSSSCIDLINKKAYTVGNYHHDDGENWFANGVIHSVSTDKLTSFNASMTHKVIKHAIDNTTLNRIILHSNGTLFIIGYVWNRGTIIINLENDFTPISSRIIENYFPYGEIIEHNGNLVVTSYLNYAGSFIYTLDTNLNILSKHELITTIPNDGLSFIEIKSIINDPLSNNNLFIAGNIRYDRRYDQGINAFIAKIDLSQTDNVVVNGTDGQLELTILERTTPVSVAIDLNYTNYTFPAPAVPPTPTSLLRITTKKIKEKMTRYREILA